MTLLYSCLIWFYLFILNLFKPKCRSSHQDSIWNRCLTTALKIFEKYREEVWIACRQLVCNVTKNEHLYKCLSKYLTSKIQLPVSNNISWWLLLKVEYDTATRAGLCFLDGKKSERAISFPAKNSNFL